MKYQVIFSLKNNEKVFKYRSSAVMIGALRINIKNPEEQRTNKLNHIS